MGRASAPSCSARAPGRSSTTWSSACVAARKPRTVPGKVPPALNDQWTLAPYHSFGTQPVISDDDSALGTGVAPPLMNRCQPRSRNDDPVVARPRTTGSAWVLAGVALALFLLAIWQFRRVATARGPAAPSATGTWRAPGWFRLCAGAAVRRVLQPHGPERPHQQRAGGRQPQHAGRRLALGEGRVPQPIPCPVSGST